MRPRLTSEEKLIAELELLGVHYLSRKTSFTAKRVRPYPVLFSDLMLHPSSRVRNALIAVLLAHPEIAEDIPSIINKLNPNNRFLLKILYTAAVALQKEYARSLKKIYGGKLEKTSRFIFKRNGYPQFIVVKRNIKNLSTKTFPIH